MNKISTGLALAGVAYMISGCGGSNSSSSPALFPGNSSTLPATEILFVSAGTPNSIDTINSDGTNRQTPIQNANDMEISKDRHLLLFDRVVNNKAQIFIATADGTQTQQVSNGSFADSQATFNPSESKIYFTRDSTGSGNTQIFSMNINGSNVNQITTNSNANLPFCSDPAVSPDGTKIAYKRLLLSAVSGIAVANTDGSNEKVAVADQGSGQPTWSPDGTKIAFSVISDFAHVQINTISPDGSQRVAITADSTGDQSSPSWSPDGTQIAFRSKRTSDNETQQLFTMPASTGGTETEITSDPNNQLSGSISWNGN